MCTMNVFFSEEFWDGSLGNGMCLVRLILLVVSEVSQHITFLTISSPAINSPAV